MSTKAALAPSNPTAVATLPLGTPFPTPFVLFEELDSITSEEGHKLWFTMSDVLAQSSWISINGGQNEMIQASETLVFMHFDERARSVLFQKQVDTALFAADSVTLAPTPTLSPSTSNEVESSEAIISTENSMPGVEPTLTSSSRSSSPSASTPNDINRKALTVGAKAGIGVGAALAILGIVIASLVFFRRGRKTRNMVQIGDEGWAKAELPAEEIPQERVYHHVYGAEIKEMLVNEVPQELEAHPIPRRIAEDHGASNRDTTMERAVANASDRVALMTPRNA
ncbi:hypothetical protein PSPO01_16271 [Paraphaeosphaeria sporulosa]